MNPQITALYELQQRDRQLTSLERKLNLIPKRIAELDDDLGKLGTMLDSERNKCDETRAFEKSQQEQLAEEEEMLRNSRGKMQQVKSPRELNALQREVEQTRRMAASRTEEILKLNKGVEEAELRIAAMNDSFASLKAQADAEKARLVKAKARLEGKLDGLRSGRGHLTSQIDADALRTYDRIRTRVGGIAFVAAYDRRCTACKMHVPHQAYVALRKGDEILGCESCGRLLYWQGHFPTEEEQAKANENKPKASPAQKRAVVAED